ncbi:FadR/GntR family transcriptional regulator [Mangrovicoccus sp. HB161399]|uniref:FadR/GntR family transcriptional regulator n=1 Tax=Mangrovicoccus sp. HB161399 TaxID=2720392 RepID=UPI0015534917|nr:FadR/GntR family transcriptional regulator [Mangrovicoccus sp. HB161399]
MARTKVHDPVAAAALETLAAVSKTPDVPLSDKVYEEILRLVVEGTIPVGQCLPTEAEFCDSFSVSRTVVREAMSRLKTDGIISSSPGKKSLVLKRPSRDVLGPPQVGSVAEVQRFHEFRELIEREAAGLAAQRAEASDLRRIREAHAAQTAAFARGEMSVENDLAFHIAIVKAARNNFLTDALASRRETFASAMNYARRSMPRDFAERSARVTEEHAAILHAIEARDADAARNYMAYHMQRGKERVFAGVKDRESGNPQDGAPVSE